MSFQGQVRSVAQKTLGVFAMTRAGGAYVMPADLSLRPSWYPIPPNLLYYCCCCYFKCYADRVQSKMPAQNILFNYEDTSNEWLSSSTYV